MNDLKAAIAGTGFIGPAHLEGLRRNNISVVGLVESTPELAREKATQLGIPRAFTSFEEMLGDPEISVVHLATPNYLHFPQAKAALLAGKHVICEKPLAVTSAESGELVRLAAEKRLVNAVHFNLRYYPMNHQARALVRRGEIGEVFAIHGSYLQDWLLFDTDWNWRLDSNEGGTLLAVADIGSHWLDLVTFITGLKITAVLADFKTCLPVRRKARIIPGESGLMPVYDEKKVKLEEYASILLRFDNGARGSVVISQVSAGRKNRLAYEIDGSRASLAFESEHPNELWIGHRDRANELLLKDPNLLAPEARALAGYPGGHNEGFPDTFKQLGKQVYDYIRRGDYSAKPAFPTFSDGHSMMKILEALVRSTREDRWIALD
ncbi:MAG: Gfo/Idh/MocA family oxidoreductase [Leptolinea sp.]|jgi:predicted dehydrogenase|nr:Gfo/Idh/MocA family oxidoreductase [Leptolinea sp.]